MPIAMQLHFDFSSIKMNMHNNNEVLVLTEL